VVIVFSAGTARGPFLKGKGLGEALPQNAPVIGLVRRLNRKWRNRALDCA
jgi:hypothetical protein